MGYAWEQQKKKAKKKAREEAEQAVSVPPPAKGTDRFSEVEAEMARLRQEMAAGRLTEAQFKERLKNLMVQDAQGTWWMIGLDTDQWYRYDGREWVPGVPPRLAAPSKGRSVAGAGAVNSSALVYLYGHRFVGEGTRTNSWIEIPCRGIKVDARGLEEQALATAFIGLAEAGFVRLYLGTRPVTLGLLKNKAVCLEPLQTGTVATGLEGRILALASDRKQQRNAVAIAKRLLGPRGYRTSLSIVAQIKRDLLEQGQFVRGRGKIAEAFLGEKLVPDCQRIGALQGEAERVRGMVLAFRQAKPQVYAQLIKDIQLAR
jgi:hypothetical protein